MVEVRTASASLLMTPVALFDEYRTTVMSFRPPPEGDQRDNALHQRGRADHDAEPLALEVLEVLDLLDLLDAGVFGDGGQSQAITGRGAPDQQARLGSPASGAELEHAVLREVGAHAHLRDDGALGLDRPESRRVVARGQDAHVRLVCVLQRLADRDGDISR